jgi:DnaJ-class molecular chaperone
MQPMHYIGLDIHKRTFTYCAKDGSGRIHAKGSIPPHVSTWTTGCDRCRGRGVRRWKPPCSPAGSTIISSHMLPLGK